MNKNNISRKDFLRNSILGMASISLAPSLLYAKDNNSNSKTMTELQTKNSPENYSIKNVRLETGFEYEDNQVIATKTNLFTLDIQGDQIVNVRENNPSEDCLDANGLLALPAFKDMHIHLDKTFYGQKWQAVRPRKGGVKQMIALEQQTLGEMLEHSKDNAQSLIELLHSKGSYFARSHVNIEPTSKLKSLTNLQEVLENNKDVFSTELVAFPQHGLFYTDSMPYMVEAAKMDIDFIGGLDPTSIDGDLQKSMDATLQLALDYNKGIDIHLHETGPSGIKTIEYLIDQVDKNPELKGKTYLSHAFALAVASPEKQKELAQGLAANDIGIMSTIPMGKLIMPIPLLKQYGVRVSAGNDSIVDHWNTMGTGSVLQKANLASALYNQTDEFGLSRNLALATQGITPLDDKGQVQWPQKGSQANIAFLDASCSAEAVSRISPVKSLIHKGKVVY
ncbi:amidohydrolase [Myroides sp. LJL115]